MNHITVKRKVNFLPNVITAFGLCCGLFVIFKMNMASFGAVDHALLTLTTGILFLAAFADLLDGTLARAIKAESSFGILFDSMADAVNFGVAPSVIVLKTLSISSGTELSYLLTAAAMVYSVCGVLRLVRFNIMGSQAAENQQLLEAHKKNFTGLPIPAAAFAIISSNLFLASEELQSVIALTPETRSWILFTQMILIGYFMISRWKFPSLKALNLRVTAFHKVFFIVLLTVFLVFYGLLQHFTITFLIVSWGYVIAAWILSIIRLIAGRKSKTLEDFEPAADEDLEVEEP